MRQDGTIVWTRALRLRLFPTDYGHAALRRAIGATCAYQSDSSSKRPGASVAFGTARLPHQPFSTCWSRRGCLEERSPPRRGPREGPAPRRPSLLRVSMWRTTPRHSIVAQARPDRKSDAHRCPRIDDR